MTVSSTTTSVSYSGNGSTTEFAVTFPFYEITVEEISAAYAVTSKTVGTHYTVSGGDGSTGTVTMLVAPASGTVLRIRRTTLRTQLTDYVENDPFPAETHEKALDRLHMIVQELEARGGFLSPNTELTIASGVISQPTALYHSVDTEGDASTDDLDSIFPGMVTSQLLVLHAASSSRTVVLKDGTGNLRLNGDFSLDHTNDMAMLIWSGSTWNEIGRSDANT